MNGKGGREEKRVYCKKVYCSKCVIHLSSPDRLWSFFIQFFQSLLPNEWLCGTPTFSCLFITEIKGQQSKERGHQPQGLCFGSVTGKLLVFHGFSGSPDGSGQNGNHDRLSQLGICEGMRLERPKASPSAMNQHPFCASRKVLGMCSLGRPYKTVI